MTPAAPNPEDRLGQTLARQADRFGERGGSPLELDQVLSRAGEIRRGRRMRATIVMASVIAAIAVPVGMNAFGDSDPTKPKPAQVATKPADRSTLSLGDYKTGEPPHVGYYANGQLRYGGSTVTLDGPAPASVARINGGFLVAQSDGSGNLTATFIDDDGTKLDTTWPTNGNFAVSSGGNVGAFVEPDGTVVAVQDGGSLHFELGTLPSHGGTTYYVDAVVGENCSGRSEQVGCTVYANDTGEKPRVFSVSPHRSPAIAFVGMTRLAGITDAGLVAGMTSFNDETGCWSVRGADGKNLWKTCDYGLDSFSPNGKYVLAHTGEGAGVSSITILEAKTGEVVLDLKAATDNFVEQQVWEDDSHVLAAVYDHGKWAVERFALNGAREYVTDTAPDPDDSYQSPFKLG